MSTQGWNNGRIRGNAYDEFIDKYESFFFSVMDDYSLNWPGLFSWFENICPIPCYISKISE